MKAEVIVHQIAYYGALVMSITESPMFDIDEERAYHLAVISGYMEDLHA